MSIDAKIRAANEQLHLVKIRQKSKRLYLRAQIPIAGSRKTERKEIPTGCPATFQGLNIAKAKAMEMESQLLLNQFDRAHWIKSSTAEPTTASTVKDWVAQFEARHFEVRERNCNSLDVWKEDYGGFFAKLPQDAPLSEELLKEIAKQYSPNSRSRLHCCRAFKSLARLAGIDTKELTRIQGNYSGKSVEWRDLPSDSQILEVWESLRSPAWKWVFGMMATFGLRNHEVFKLDLRRIKECPAWVEVGSQTKTGRRLVRAFPDEWVGLMNLREVRLPNVGTENRPNRDIGGVVSYYLRHELKIPFTPYSLRHAYAVRMAIEGITESVAARLMGHSISVHCKTYQAFLTERHINEAFEKAQQRRLGTERGTTESDRSPL